MKTKLGNTASVDSLKLYITFIIVAIPPVMLVAIFVNINVVLAYVPEGENTFYLFYLLL
jgi:hypothetical protein